MTQPPPGYYGPGSIDPASQGQWNYQDPSQPNQAPYQSQPGYAGQQPGNAQSPYGYSGQVEPAPASQPAPMGTLRFTAQGNMWTNSLVAPTAILDGYRLPISSSSGSTDFPIPAGQHHLRVNSSWLIEYGVGEINFVVQPGQFVEIFYAAPFHQFAKQGGIGFTPQQKPGMVGFLLILLVPIGIGLAVAFFALLAGLF